LLGNGDVVVCGETCSEFRSNYTPTGSAPTTSCTTPPQVGPWPAPQQTPACDTINGPPGSAVPTDGYVAVLSADLTQLKYWSFIRGDDDDRAYAVAPGSNDTIWVCGFTDSTITTTAPVAFPFVTSGIAPIPSVYGTLPGGHGDRNAFIARFNSTLSAIERMIVFGAAGTDTPRGSFTVVRDPGNNPDNDKIFITGRTAVGAGFPGPDPPRGGTDAFAMRFRGNGILIWSRILGGEAEDAAEAGIRFVGDPGSGVGHVFLGGHTRSLPKSGSNPLGFEVTAGAHKTMLSGAADAFLAKLDAVTGQTLALTYVGGDQSDFGGANDCLELDWQNRPVLAGYTCSQNWEPPFNSTITIFPTGSAPNCQPQTSLEGNPVLFDAFVVVLDASLSSPNLVFGSFFGGVDREEPSGLAIDSNHSIYLSGETRSSRQEGFPITPNAFDLKSTTFTHPNYSINDGFLMKFFFTETADISPASMLLYSTYFGGDCPNTASGNDPSERGSRPRGLVNLPTPGEVLMVGGATMIDMPTTVGVIFPIWRRGLRDGWIAKHNTN
jgi:hypothetical protein